MGHTQASKLQLILSPHILGIPSLLGPSIKCENLQDSSQCIWSYVSFKRLLSIIPNVYPPSVMERKKNHVSFLAYKKALGRGIFRSKCPLALPQGGTFFQNSLPPQQYPTQNFLEHKKSKDDDNPCCGDMRIQISCYVGTETFSNSPLDIFFKTQGCPGWAMPYVGMYIVMPFYLPFYDSKQHAKRVQPIMS